MLDPKVFDFLADLHVNNTREWFHANKSVYLEAKKAFDQYVESLILAVKSVDKTIGSPEAKDCIFRIYRDVRFSKNKEPYKNYFGAYVTNGGRKSELPGYYLHVQPGDKSFVGGGVYRPQPKILAALREEIVYYGNDFRAITEAPDFKACFTQMQGSKLKTAPRGYAKNHPEIDLLRFKDFTFVQQISDEELLAENLTEKLQLAFEQLSKVNVFFRRAFE